MASWKEERDRLVAQTLAFVQQVASAHPTTASKLGMTSTGAPLPGSSPVVEAIDAPIANTVVLDAQLESAAVPSNVAADLPVRPTQYATASERSDITQRVAAFKARQTTLNREREAYYDSVQARIRSSLRNDTDSSML